MVPMGRVRHKLSACLLWCALLALYLGGTIMLVIGLIVASRTWWALIHQHASLWAISAKTTEVLALAVGLMLVLIIPIFQHQSFSRKGPQRSGQKPETKHQVPLAE
jgi:hypothetical protein